MDAAQPSVVFVVGAGRSGTTITASLLNRLPGVAIAKETGYIGLSMPLLERIDDPQVLDRLLADVNSWLERERWTHRASAAGFAEFCDRSGLHGAPAFLHYVWQLDATTPWRELTWIGDNTPLYVMAIPAILAVLPEARFIHVVRDPRDVACSIVRMRFGADDLMAAALEWHATIGAWLMAERLIPPNQRCEIRYEDLCTDSQTTLTKLAVFLGRTSEDAAAALAAQDCSAGDCNAGFGRVATMQHHQRLTESLSPSRVGRFRNELTASQIETVERVAQYGMMACGYELDHWRTSPWMNEDRRALLAAQMRDITRRVWKRLKSMGR